MTHEPPKFKLGTEIRVGYLGIYRWDEMPGPNSGIRGKPGLICGLRLVFDFEEQFERLTDGSEGDSLGYTIVYPRGWEYAIVRQTRDGFDPEWEWWPEAELLKHEYKPNVG